MEKFESISRGKARAVECLRKQVTQIEAKLTKLEPRSAALANTISELRLRRIRALRRLETMAAVREAEGKE